MHPAARDNTTVGVRIKDVLVHRPLLVLKPWTLLAVFRGIMWADPAIRVIVLGAIPA
jgi:hypothetical protein